MTEFQSGSIIGVDSVAIAAATVAPAISAAVASTTPTAATTVSATSAAWAAATTTTPAVATASANTTPSANTTFARLGDIHRKRAAVHRLFIQSRDRRVRLGFVGHFDKPETTRPTGLTIRDDLRTCDSTILLKHRVQLIRRGGPGEITNVNVRRHARTEIVVPCAGDVPGPVRPLERVLTAGLTEHC